MSTNTGTHIDALGRVVCSHCGDYSNTCWCPWRQGYSDGYHYSTRKYLDFVDGKECDKYNSGYKAGWRANALGHSWKQLLMFTEMSNDLAS